MSFIKDIQHRARTLRDLVNILVPCNKLRRDGDASCGLDLVSSKHTNLDSTIEIIESMLSRNLVFAVRISCRILKLISALISIE